MRSYLPWNLHKRRVHKSFALRAREKKMMEERRKKREGGGGDWRVAIAKFFFSVAYTNWNITEQWAINGWPFSSFFFSPKTETREMSCETREKPQRFWTINIDEKVVRSINLKWFERSTMRHPISERLSRNWKDGLQVGRSETQSFYRKQWAQAAIRNNFSNSK